MRQSYNANRSSNFRPRGRGPFRGGHQPYRPPTQGQIDHLMLLAQESVAAQTGFSKLPMESLLLGALKSETFETPTPIQSEAIPLAMMGRDILGCAQTGTGKTLAFVIPILNQLLQKPDAKALILAPTRELALQIEEVIKPLTKKINLGLPVLLIGGVSYQHQFRGLEEPHRIIVATPGRLIDHLGQETVNLSSVQSLVLDEADRMLDVGFKPQLLEILKYLPQERQTMMFTATLSSGVKALSAKYLRNPAHLKVGETDRAHANITQKVVQLEASKKHAAVLDLLKEYPGTALIFVKTQVKTERVAAALEDLGVMAAPIHGGLNQGQRKRALQAFRDEQVRVLVATDVAARGLDIDHVALVVNYDLPQVIEDYVHRIGRTGRAGKSGVAVSLVSGEDRGLWRIIERKYISTETSSRDRDNLRGPREYSQEGRRERSSDFRRDRRSGPDARREDRQEFAPRSRPNRDFSESREQRSEKPRFTPSERPRFTPSERPRFVPSESKPKFTPSEAKPRFVPSNGVGVAKSASAPARTERSERPQRSERPAFPKRETSSRERDESAGWEPKKSHFGRKPATSGPFKGKKSPSPRKTFRKFED